LVASVGRGRQPELFESWLPDTAIRTCVSRNAFEVSWKRGADGPFLTAQGSGPVSLDGKVVPVKVPFALRHGAEIGLLYGKQLLIRFRFHDTSSNKAVYRSYTGSLVSGSQSVVVATGDERQHSAVAPSPAASSHRVLQTSAGISFPFGPGERGGPSTMSTPRTLEASGYNRPMTWSSVPGHSSPNSGGSEAVMASPAAPGRSLTLLPRGNALAAPAARWRLACIRAEGMSEERLAQLPPVTAHLVLPEAGGELLIGRDHQPRLLSAWLPDPVVRLCIARTHLRVRATEQGLVATNFSPSPLYIEDQPLHQNEDRVMQAGQVLSFMRSDRSVSSDMIPFLVLRLMPQGSTSPSANQRWSWAPGQVNTLEEEGPSANRLLQPMTQKSLSSSMVAGQISSSAAPVVALELWGERVTEAPVEKRRVGPISLAGKPLLVGSRHQPEILNEALLQGLAGVVDRDHYCIASEGGVFRHLCLTPKGLWRVREGKRHIA